MFTEDDLLDIHFGIHGDARAIQTRFGYIPVENRPVKYGGVVRCVTINKYEFMEQNIKEKNDWAQKTKEGHDITWITTLKPPGQIVDGEIKSSCYSIIRRDPPEQPQPVPKRQRIESHMDVGLSSSQKTLSPSQSQDSEPTTPVKTRGKEVVLKVASPEEISNRRVVKAKARRSLSPNKEKDDVEIKDAAATVMLSNGEQEPVRRSSRLKTKKLKKGPSLMSLETDLEAYKVAHEEEDVVVDESPEHNSGNNTHSKTLQQSTLIDIEIMNKSQDSSALNSSQAQYYEDSAEPMISSQESTPAKRKMTRKLSTMMFTATPMVDIDSFAGPSLHQNLTPMDVDQNTFQSGSTVTKSVVMKTLVSPMKDVAKSNGTIHDNSVNNRDSDTLLANFVGENGNEIDLKTDQNNGSVGHFDTKLRTVRRSTFEIDFHELRVGKKLGAGAFGEVLKGTYRRVPVAIKILASQDKEAQKMFMKEVILLWFYKNKIHITKKCSISLIRLRTALRVTSAILASSVFWFVPEAYVILDPAGAWPVWMTILVGILMSASHSLGGSLQSAKYLLASGLVAAVPNLAFYPLTHDSVWIGIAMFTFWTAVIGLLYVAADPKLTHVTCVRFIGWSLLLVLIFPPPFDTNRNFYYSPPVQYIMLSIIGYIFCIASLLLFPARWVIKLPREFSLTLKRCNKMLLILLKLSKKSRLTMKIKKLEELIVRGDEMTDLDRKILAAELERDADTKKLTHISNKLIKNIRWLYSMLEESKLERWVNPEIFAAEEEIVKRLDSLVANLVTMKISLGQGLVKRSNTVHDILPKLMPQIELLQNRFYAHVDVTRDKLHYVFTSKEKDYAKLQEEDMQLIEAGHPKFAADPSRRPTLQSLIEIISEEYLEQIKDMEYNGELRVTPTSEVTRMNFYLWQLISLVEKLQALDEAVTKFSELIHHDETWHYNYAVKSVLAYPFVDVYLVFKDITNKTGKPQKEYLRNFKQIWYNQQWKYPIRLAVFGAIISVASVYVAMIIPNVRSYWTMITFIIILTPTVGATFKRGVHRVIGTIIGATVALAAMVCGTYANPLAIFIAFTFVFCFFATYIQYSEFYQKPYSMVVAVLTFLIVAYPSYPNVSWMDWTLLYRFLNILAGVILGILTSLPWPVLTYRRLKDSYLTTISKCADIMGTILSVSDVQINNIDVSAQVAELNSIIQTQSKWLKEAKSELYFKQLKRRLYITFMEHISNLVFLLTAAEGALHGGFSAEMVQGVFKPLEKDFQQISKIAEIQVHLFRGFMTTSSLHPTYHIAAKKIKAVLKKIQRRHRMTRQSEISSKQLHKWHPEMLKFNAFLYTISSLLHEWRKMMKVVEKVKKDD